MGTSIFSLLKTMTMAIAVVAVIALSHSVAKADEVTVAGYTNGCFGGGCVAPNTSAYQSASLLGLSYGNATFSNTTVGGFLAYGGNPQVVPGPQNLNNLGSFTLASSTAIYTGNSFTLRVTFTLPTGINGSSTSLFTAICGQRPKHNPGSHCRNNWPDHERATDRGSRTSEYAAIGNWSRGCSWCGQTAL